MKYYADYVWRRGIPYGLGPLSDLQISTQTSYKLISDPYRKHNSIEEYSLGCFERIIYDSALFDFRQILRGEQPSWQKTVIAESANFAHCLIRNQDDRLVLIETYQFVDGLCTECTTSSPHGLLLSRQKIDYILLKGEFNGVTLYDAKDRRVMKKEYEFDPQVQQFTTLIKEDWG